MTTVLHTADWHLSSPISCKLDPARACTRREELLARFADMVTYAKEHHIAAVLLCGDMGDNGVLPFTVQDYLIDTVASVPEIRFFLVSGNHDRISAPSKDGGISSGIFTRGRRALPKNLHIFADTWDTVTLCDGVTVSGMSFDGHSVAPTLPALSAQTYNIVCLHGTLIEADGTLGGENDTIPLPRFAAANVDYLALGHYHAIKHGTLGKRGVWFYPGCPEGRGFDECGDKGFVVLKLNGGTRIGSEFVPFAKRCLHKISLDVTDIPAGLSALETACNHVTSAIPETDLVRIVLCGEDAPEMTRNTQYLERRLSEKFWYAEVTDGRRVKQDITSFRYDVSLRGEFVRRVLASPLSEEERAEILRLGLSAFEGNVTL